MTRLALILAAVLLAGCVASSEQEEQACDGIDAWQMGRVCAHLYYQRSEFDLRDSGQTCPDGRLSEPMGHTRRLVADNCGESLWLADYRVIWGCLRVWAPMDAIPL